jgi:heme-degrading monooxygenase HmoA
MNSFDADDPSSRPLLQCERTGKLATVLANHDDRGEKLDMADNNMILRKWAGRIRAVDEAAYLDYVARTGAADYEATQGNLGSQVLMREMGDGTTEITTLSWWTSMEAIRRFAGDDPTRARYYADDDKYLLDRPETVEHYRVMAVSPPRGVVD